MEEDHHTTFKGRVTAEAEALRDVIGVEAEDDGASDRDLDGFFGVWISHKFFVAWGGDALQEGQMEFVVRAELVIQDDQPLERQLTQEPRVSRGTALGLKEGGLGGSNREIAEDGFVEQHQRALAVGCLAQVDEHELLVISTEDDKGLHQEVEHALFFATGDRQEEAANASQQLWVGSIVPVDVAAVNLTMATRSNARFECVDVDVDTVAEGQPSVVATKAQCDVSFLAIDLRGSVDPKLFGQL